jgi:predicted dehydrogenase
MGWASEWASVSDFYRDRKQAGGGVMLDLGCHLLDLADYLCGEADSARCLGVDFGDKGGTLEKALSAELTFPSGLQGLVGVSRLTNLANVITVTGEAGWASASLDGEELSLGLPATPLCTTGAARTRLPLVEPFAAMWQRFAGAVSRGWLDPDEGLCDTEAGIRSVRLVESLYRELGL